MSGDSKNLGGESGPSSEDRTDPGGPSPLLMEEARRLAAASTVLVAPGLHAAALQPSSREEPTRPPGPGEATLIYDKNRRPAEQARLLVTAGPRAGAEFVLTEAETTIGRGSDNTLAIPDISVSRHHLVIRREGDRYLLTDLGSGNGSRVNDQLVEQHQLQSGDEIGLGDTQMRFLEPGGVVVRPRSGRLSVPPPAEAPPAHGPGETQSRQRPSGLKARAPLYIGLTVALLVLLGIGALRKRQREQSEAEAAHAHDEGRAFAQQRFDEGVKLLKEGRWVAARDRLKVAAELSPQDPEIQRYLDRAEAEAPRAQAVEQARAALGRRDYAAAREALQNLPDDSALAEPARELGRQIAVALDSAVREARIKVENGDLTGAAALVDPVLAAEPERADALAVREAASRTRRPAQAKVERPRAREKAAAEAPPSAAYKAIVDAYLTGDIGTAEELADAAQEPRSQRLAKELRSFDTAYREGLSKTQARRLGEAIRALDQADKIDRSLAAGRESRLGKEVRRALGNLHYNLAAQAMGQEEGLGVAAVHLRAAVVADPDNEAAGKQLAEVIERAREIYQRAYFEKDSEPDSARKLFRVVAEALPPGDETGEKARRWADKLDGKGGEKAADKGAE